MDQAFDSHTHAYALEDPEVCAPVTDDTKLMKPPLSSHSRVAEVDFVPTVTLVEPCIMITEEDHFAAPVTRSLPVDEGNSPLAAVPVVAPETDPSWQVLEPSNAVSVESAIERVLLLVLEPAIGGLPGVQSADSRASELLLKTEGDVEKAVRLVGEEEVNFHRKQLVVEFLLKQAILPFFLGLPFSLILNTFTNIRAVAVVARLYGHNLGCARTRHEILLCLLPGGPTASAPSSQPQGEEEGALQQTARSVARSLAGPLLGRATGISMAGDILSLGSELAGTSGDFSVVNVTPAMTARHYFCPEVTSEWLRLEVALLVLGMMMPTLMNANLKIYFGLLNVAILAVAGAEKFNVPRSRLSGIGVLLFFVVWACLPLLNIVSAFNTIHRAFSDKSNMVIRFSLFLLGVLNLVISVTRQYNSQATGVVGASRLGYERGFTYARLALCTLVIPQLIAADEAAEDYRGSLLFSAWYVLSLLSSFCQQRIVGILKRREAFLKLLGTERVLTLSLTLLLKGLSRNITDELRKFLAALTPPPAVVCGLHAVRLHAIEMALLLEALPKISELIFPGKVNFYLGLLGGGAVLGLMVREWGERDYTSNNRIFLIMPGEIDAKVRELLTNTGSRAARLVFMSMIKAMFSSLVRRFTSVQ